MGILVFMWLNFIVTQQSKVYCDQIDEERIANSLLGKGITHNFNFDFVQAHNGYSFCPHHSKIVTKNVSENWSLGFPTMNPGEFLSSVMQTFCNTF